MQEHETKMLSYNIHDNRAIALTPTKNNTRPHYPMGIVTFIGDKEEKLIPDLSERTEIKWRGLKGEQHVLWGNREKKWGKGTAHATPAYVPHPGQPAQHTFM